MATLEEMIKSFDAAPRPERQEVPARTIWQRIKGEWPEFRPPPIPRTGLTLEWVWRRVLDEDPTPPSAEEMAAAAAEEDRRFPECQEALYRRQHPEWLEERMTFAAEYHSEQRWQEVERYLDGGRGLPPERMEWLRRHEELIRALVEKAKDEHLARYGDGWLKRALARIAEQRRS